MRFFTSDMHFSHWSEWVNAEGELCGRGIISFERNQFSNIHEHDMFLVDKFTEWAKKLNKDASNELWVLGDWGNTDFLYLINMFQCKKFFVYGNHDSKEDKPLFEAVFDEVYEYPVFLSQKLVVSHFPVAVYEDCINVNGHLHGSKLGDINHINASIHVANYNLISEKQVSAQFAKIPKFTRRFLYEPYAEDYVFTQEKEDCIYDKNGRIDLSASRLLMKQQADKRAKNNEPYRPYVGGLGK